MTERVRSAAVSAAELVPSPVLDLIGAAHMHLFSLE